MADLEGKVVVITGGSSGIGLATARAFAREGCRVALGARDADRLAEALTDVEACGGEVLALVTDIQVEQQARALVGAARERWGRVDVLVNNAGYGVLKPFVDMSTSEVRDQMATNYYGAVYATKAALQDMLPRHSGHIINILSIAVQLPMPNYSAYSATKAALDSLTQTLRAELSQHGVYVTGVYPSGTRTEFLDRSGTLTGVRRYTRRLSQKPETVAAAIVRVVKRPRPDVYPLLGTRLLPPFRTLFTPAMRVLLRTMARVYR